MKPITQKQIAEVLGVLQPTVSKYLNGKLDISAKDALKLKRALKIPIEAWENPTPSNIQNKS